MRNAYHTTGVSISSSSIHACENYFRIGSKIDHHFLKVAHEVGYQICLVSIDLPRDVDGKPKDVEPLHYERVIEIGEKMRVLQVIMSPSQKKDVFTVIGKAA